MEISSKYQPLFELIHGRHDEVDTVIITGGRLSGKSFSVGLSVSEGFIQKDWKILYTRFTNLSIKDSIYSEFINQLENTAYFDYTEIKQDRVASTVGSGEVVFKGIKTNAKNQTANLKSLSGFNCFVVDEAEEIPDKETFKKVYYSIRSKEKRNLSILILNPASKDHWIYQEYFKSKKVEDGYCGIKDNVLYIHTNYLDVNPEFVPNNIRRDYEILKEDNPDEYNQIVLGGWVEQSKGKLYSKEQLNYYNTSTYKEELKEHTLGHIDVAVQGNDYLCFVIADVIGKNIYIKDVLFSQEDTSYTDPASKEFIKEHKPEYVWVENNGSGYIFASQLKDTSDSTTIIDYHQSANKHSRIISKSGFIKRHVYFKEDYVSQSDYDLFIKQIFQYSKDKKENKDIHDDAIDSLSSLVDFIQKYLLGNWD